MRPVSVSLQASPKPEEVGSDEDRILNTGQNRTLFQPSAVLSRGDFRGFPWNFPTFRDRVFLKCTEDPQDLGERWVAHSRAERSADRSCNRLVLVPLVQPTPRRTVSTVEETGHARLTPSEEESNLCAF